MRVRSGRFNQLALSTKPLCRVALRLAPQLFDADQALRLQPRVGHRLLRHRGSCHVPVAVAADPVLDGRLQAHAQGQQVAYLRARPAPDRKSVV